MIGTVIITGIVIIISQVFGLYTQTAFSNGETIKAAYLAEEGIEVVRHFRDASWDTNITPLVLETNYGLVWEGSAWQASTTKRYVDEFERQIVLSAVQRDGNGDIVEADGVVDPETLLVTSSVSWIRASATTTKSVSTYITNFYDN